MKLVQTYSTKPDLKRLIGFKINYLDIWFTVFTFVIEGHSYTPSFIYPIPRRTTWSDFSEIA